MYMLCLGSVFLDALSVLLRICPEIVQQGTETVQGLNVFTKELIHYYLKLDFLKLGFKVILKNGR